MTLTPTLVEAIATDLVLPVIRELGNETSQRIHAVVVLIHKGEIAKVDIRSDAAVHLPPDAHGEVRIWFRDIYRKDTFKFELESIFQGVAGGTGYSGFEICGNFHFSNEVLALKSIGKTSRYNVWTWSEKFRL